ncbi:hypothetical protein [Sinimarinibacterium flocculans]|uniref:hypothetical protein n=1 Tax=Sinimarinibacterium flocculans TaxID=985250 RepID=UPI0035131ECC
MAAKGWTMTAVAIAVAAGTYFTLETLYPPSKNGDVDLRLVPPEAVFGSSLQTDVAQTAMADDAPAVAEREPAATPDTADGMTDPLPDAVDGTADGEYGLAGEAPTDDTAEDAEDSDAGFEDAPPAEDAAPADTETAPADAQAVAPATTSAPTPKPPAPTPTPTAAPTAAPTPAATPRPTPAATPRATASAPAAARLTQWWGPEADGRLSVVYAGSAAYTRAIVLMFNGAFADASSAQQHLRVRDAAGKAVEGRWEVGTSNRRMLLFPVARTGTYTVTVGGGLADRDGRTVGNPLQGPVRVQ